MNRAYTIVTGAGGSIGEAITRTLASEGRNVIMACRNLTKDTPLCQEINKHSQGNITIAQLDLASLDSVAAFVRHIQQEGYAIECLINNAGIMNKTFKTTRQGHELTIGVNFIGTYLLTELLLPTIKEGGNITFTTSLTRHISKVDKNFFLLNPDNYTRFKAYANSKSAITIYAAQLARKMELHNIYVNAADPGVVDTDMIRMDTWIDPLADLLFRPLISSPLQGAMGSIAASKSHKTGMIFTGKEFRPIAKRFARHSNAHWLIAETNKIVAHWLK